MDKVPIGKIISGGQSRADRAALDWAIENAIPHGGWCPKGRRAEEGIISERYELEETCTVDTRPVLQLRSIALRPYTVHTLVQ